MRNTILLICTLLVASSLTLNINPAGEKQVLLAEVYADDFGSQLLHLISMHTSLGGRLDEIYQALEDIRQHLVDEGLADEANWEVESALLQNIIDTNTATYEQAVLNVADFTSQLETYNEQLPAAEELLVQLTQDRASLVTRIANHNEMVERETAAFGVRQLDDQEAIDACNGAIEILTTFPEYGTVNSGNFDFLQIDDVTKTLKEKARSDNNLYMPIIGALTTLVQTQSASPATCYEIVNLLKDLRDQIIVAKATDAGQFVINTGLWTTTSEDMASQLESLNTNIDQTEDNISNLRVLITDTNALLATEETIRDNAYAAFTEAQIVFDEKEAAFWARDLIRKAQTSLLQDLYDYMQEDMQGFADELDTTLDAPVEAPRAIGGDTVTPQLEFVPEALPTLEVQ